MGTWPIWDGRRRSPPIGEPGSHGMPGGVGKVGGTL